MNSTRVYLATFTGVPALPSLSKSTVDSCFYFVVNQCWLRDLYCALVHYRVNFSLGCVANLLEINEMQRTLRHVNNVSIRHQRPELLVRTTYVSAVIEKLLLQRRTRLRPSILTFLFLVSNLVIAHVTTCSCLNILRHYILHVNLNDIMGTCLCQP